MSRWDNLGGAKSESPLEEVILYENFDFSKNGEQKEVKLLIVALSTYKAVST